MVCQEIFGTRDPRSIAERIVSLCEAALGTLVAGARFYSVSVGCVAGLDLEDGRAVVVKVNRAERPLAYFETCATIRTHLADHGFPCPRPLGAPRRAGSAIATFEELVDRGARGDAHDPGIRGLVAGSLAEMVAIGRPFASALRGAWFSSVPDDRIFPRPHSPLFDFEKTAEGAGWIDDLARRARARRLDAAGERVVGHFDWRVEHLRFEGGRVVTSYDWDSLHGERETILVGATAHAFTADWTRDDLIQVPSLEEMRGFVADYERARGRIFDPPERRTIAASLVYSTAYTARCNHALSPREEGDMGDFRPLLRAHGDEILERF